MLGNKISVLVLLLFIITLTGCKRNPFRVDISGIKVGIGIKRLDRDLFGVTPLNQDEKIPLLKKEYKDFFELYNYKIIELGNPSSPDYQGFLQSFLTHPTLVEAKLKVDSVFTELEKVEEGLSLAFRYYKYYFPEKSIPTVYACISGFNQSIIIDKGILGISLDNYLGSDCELYRRLAFPEYKRMNMYPEKIVTDALQGWVTSEMDIDVDKSSLLDNMIYYGKVMYFMDALFPGYPDYQKIGFTDVQVDWCKNNEARMWTYIVENRFLFSLDRLTIRRYIGPGPHTSGFSEQSPGRSGIWIGWQIVKKYMAKSPDLSVVDLFGEEDYQKILAGSKYSP